MVHAGAADTDDDHSGPNSASSALIFIVAGEPSGDLLGARLIRALRERSSIPLRFAGVGGRMMEREGLRSLFPLSDIAVMGVSEVAARLPLVLRRLREVGRAAIEASPVAVVTIDSSSFNKRLARQLIRAGSRAPRIHYVAPMVWAWRPNRTRKMAKLFDHLITLLPFEPDSFRAAGLPATWAGHPLVEQPSGNGEGFRRRHGISHHDKVVLVLPGSRAMEVSRLLPILRAAVDRLRPDIPSLHTVIPTVDSVSGIVEEGVRNWPGRVTLIRDENEKAAAFSAGDAAVAASGTVTLELALAHVPMVVVYRASPLTAFFARRLIRVPYLSLVNIIAGRPVVPELLQEACTPHRVVRELRGVILDDRVRQRQEEGFEEMSARLTPPGARTPSQRAADIVLSLAFPEGGTQTHRTTQGEVTRDE